MMVLSEIPAVLSSSFIAMNVEPAEEPDHICRNSRGR